MFPSVMDRLRRSWISESLLEFLYICIYIYIYIYIIYMNIYIYIYIYHGRNSKSKCLVKLVKHIYYKSKNATNEKSTQKRQLLAQSQQ